MKPAPFEYAAPETVEEAVRILAENADRAKILAGGQSLVPMQNLRLARPEMLVDINGIDSASFVMVDSDVLRIGALARHIQVEEARVPGPLGGLLEEVGRQVGHLPIRLRGTFCGSLAHADPAAEWCALLATAKGNVVARGLGGDRVIAADDFFDTAFTTSLALGEMVVEARLPVLSEDWRFGTAFLSRRAGDFAVVLVIALIRVVEEKVAEARIGLGGVSDRPVRARSAEAMLVGERLNRELLEHAGRAAADGVEPLGDLHGTAEFRRHLVKVLVPRALSNAWGLG